MKNFAIIEVFENKTDTAKIRWVNECECVLTKLNPISNQEKRKGDYHCAGCGTKLFSSEMKYESGSGWPSFFSSLPEVFETKTDNYLGYSRTEYHCKNCGGHHGHIFEDGPQPTGKRYCNNGLCLIFIPD